MNHVRLWNKCIELNETIAVIEQDSFCVRSWQPVAFDDVLIMNFESAWNQRIFKGFWKEGNHHWLFTQKLGQAVGAAV